MAYKGFTWNCAAGDCEALLALMIRIRDDKTMFKVDRHLASYYISSLERFLEVTPDGSTPTHGTADA